MAAAGAVAFSDDGAPTRSLKALYNAARYALDLAQPFLSHCDDPSFDNGLMNAGDTSERLGLSGSPSVSEAAIAARDIMVAQATGKAWHLCHVSAAQTVELLAFARGAGINVTAEVTPHHLQCTDDMLASFDARYRVNPQGCQRGAHNDLRKRPCTSRCGRKRTAAQLRMRRFQRP